MYEAPEMQTNHPMLKSAGAGSAVPAMDQCYAFPLPLTDSPSAEGSTGSAECKDNTNSILERSSDFFRITHSPWLLVPHHFFLWNWPPGSRTGEQTLPRQTLAGCFSLVESNRISLSPSTFWNFQAHMSVTISTTLKCYRSINQHRAPSCLPI